MSIIKCKMCGGDLNLQEGQSVAECEYCGSRQTVPAADNEKKLQQFQRADWLRRNCEFDRAAAVYESIVAEFREESEAYWGLVLCKYGIEYVDDPGTGKKIPTCHRSSFESVMEDPSLEMAMDYADAVARRVYREEAKQIEELRKGIIAVSANEQPYDIFICYKETDEKGDRTLDSVLAQDIYDALTDRGYRVFFARISLEDKLGVEYEPYIFAALNSAKIMLAVGTDYEYYNAVWVKNEWSRFLKLMAQDKSKYLIPCFKGLDAYDMPKEFAKLQAQDLGKVGAMQDLLRGVEKILPKESATPVSEAAPQAIPQTVTLPDNKIASMLDRGFMALEDEDWVKADNFFEEVLNYDSKNAQAYLGKALAQERCWSLEQLIDRRLAISKDGHMEKLCLPSNAAYIEQVVRECTIPGFLEKKEIQDLFDFDLQYQSCVKERKKQKLDAENYWVKHKLLTKAEKFAQGELKKILEEEKTRLFDTLAMRVKIAENEEEEVKQDIADRYIQHLRQADIRAEQLYVQAKKQREYAYDVLTIKASKARNCDEMMAAAQNFRRLGNYKDSQTLALKYEKSAKEREEERIIAERKAKRLAEKKSRIRDIIIMALLPIMLLVWYLINILN